MSKCFKSTLKLIVSILFFQSVNMVSHAQTDFRPGYIITNETDTVLGLLDYRGDIRNCRICAFKQNEQAEIQEFLPGEIFAYRFEKSKYYISKNVKIEKDTIEIFAEYLVDGIIDLYYYADMNGGHYLLELEDGIITELDVETITDFDDKLYNGYYQFKYKKYIGILKATFAQYPQLFDDINRAELTHKSLANITKHYHDYVCKDEKCIMYTKDIPVVTFDFAIFSGVNIQKINVTKGMYVSENYSTSVFPALKFNSEIKLPRVNEKLSVFLTVEFSRIDFSSVQVTALAKNKTISTKKISAFPVNILGGLKYTYPTGKIRPTIGLGAGISNLSGLNTSRRFETLNNSVVVTTLSEDVDLGNALPGLRVFFGMIYLHNAKRIFSLQLDYSDFWKTNHESSVRTNSWSIVLGYNL